MTPLNPVFAKRPVTIFAVMTALADKFGAVNLGQGFPDEDGPSSLIAIAARAMEKGPNQYAPVGGHPALREALARANNRFYGLDIDAKTQTLVTAGATEAIAASFMALLRPGDEAILLAPFYDCYAPMVEAAGARPVIVRLNPPDWRIDGAAIEAAITPKTRVIAINSPHNPTGRVLTREELETLADIVRKHDLVAVCDEVYEHLLFDGRSHIPLMTLPDMADRCVRIGSAGKTFSMTGWRIGYLTGPERLIAGITKAHQFIAYTCAPHLQVAVAAGLDFPDEYFDEFVAGMQQKRDLMQTVLKEAGFDALACEGTYFVNADITSVGRKGDMAFCREITEKAGVAAVPLSAFYYGDDGEAPRSFARFCFCKKREVIEEAGDRLRRYFS